MLESGFDAVVEQRTMVVDALTFDGLIGISTHVLFFAHHPEETDVGTAATVTPGPRADYLALFASSDVCFVASGHCTVISG